MIALALVALARVVTVGGGGKDRAYNKELAELVFMPSPGPLADLVKAIIRGKERSRIVCATLVDYLRICEVAMQEP